VRAQLDLLPAVKSLAKVLGVMVVLGSGNIFLWGICYFVWKKLRAAPVAGTGAIA
jgi:hypothetical protein